MNEDRIISIDDIAQRNPEQQPSESFDTFARPNQSGKASSPVFNREIETIYTKFREEQAEIIRRELEETTNDQLNNMHQNQNDNDPALHLR